MTAREEKDVEKVSLSTILRVGWLIGFRQVQRSSIWLNVLIIGIMTLTFLNLVVISGILVGLIVGGNAANREQYTGDVFIDELADNSTIENTQPLISTLEEMPGVENFSVRYTTGAQIEANYQNRRDFNALPNTIGTTLAGIDPLAETAVTNLHKYIVEGEYLDPNQSGYILVGATLLEQYSSFSDLFEPLQNVHPGDRVKITVSGQNRPGNQFDPNANQTGTGASRTMEFIVKGIVNTKVGDVSSRLFVTESDFNRLTGRPVPNANEIAVVTSPTILNTQIKSDLVQNGFDKYARIRTAEESIPKFLNDIQLTFGLLGNVIGFIGIVVSAITIFVVVYINALTRRKYIGILKGVGIRGQAIQLAYVLQALFYASVGSLIGFVIVYAFLVPFFLQHPLNFPFSDGILVAPLSGTLIRILALMIVTALAGYIPARLIIRQNTLDSILGR